jgi:hypothetical protein
MPLFARAGAQRGMTALARTRRRTQQLGPYQSLALLMVPVGLAEPLKLVALFVVGTGHWFSGMTIIVGAYAVSIFIIERLFRVVKPKLMTMGWFARLWTWISSFPCNALMFGVGRYSALAVWLLLPYLRSRPS